MDWTTAAPLILGAVLALLGGFGGQLFAARIARNREERDRAHERAVWLREQRQIAHREFIAAVTQVRIHLESDPEGDNDGLLTELMTRSTQIRLVCSEHVADRADALGLDSADIRSAQDTSDKATAGLMKWRGATMLYLDAAKSELGQLPTTAEVSSLKIEEAHRNPRKTVGTNDQSSR